MTDFKLEEITAQSNWRQFVWEVAEKFVTMPQPEDTELELRLNVQNNDAGDKPSLYVEGAGYTRIWAYVREELSHTSYRYAGQRTGRYKVVIPGVAGQGLLFNRSLHRTSPSEVLITLLKEARKGVNSWKADKQAQQRAQEAKQASADAMARLAPTLSHVMAPAPFSRNALVLNRLNARLFIDAETTAGQLVVTINLPASPDGEAAARHLVTEFMYVTAPTPTDAAQDRA